MPRRKPRKPPLSDEALQLVARRFQSLGDATRLRVLNLLMQGERSVREIVEETGLEQSNVSRHLSVLRREGIVGRRADGNRAYYRIHDPTIVPLCELVCGGLMDALSDDLDALPDASVWKGSGI